MPRYIDADLEVSDYVTVWDCDCSEFGKQTVMAVGDLQYLPAADVVPKSEVVKVLDEIEKKVKASITIHLEEINKEYIVDTPLYDRHSGIIFALQGMDDFIAELKKKYTEEKT